MSRLALFPPVATVYPNDVQKFTAKAVPQPSMWFGVASSGDIASDFSLFVDGAQSSVAGNGAHKLYSGIGFAEWTVDDNFRPTSSGSWNITGGIQDVAGFLYLYRVTVSATQILIQDEALNTLTTISYSTVSGDAYRLELANGFRLYRNGVLLHSRVSLGTQTIYPMSYSSNLIKPVITNPARILAPRLVGDWRLSETVTFTAPSHGSISATGPGLETTYSGGTVPGTYTLTGQIEPGSDAEGVQKATAIISIPPLQILGDKSITLQPGQKIRPKTNYDEAQGNLVSWSIPLGGGSFTQGEFTAPALAGLSTLRATASVNSNIAEISALTAAVITNANGYTAAKASEQIDFDTNIPLIPYFAGAGAFAEGTGNITPGLPVGIQANDILLLFVESANQTVSAPSGYAAVADSPQGTGTGGASGSVRLDIFWKRATANETAPTVTDPGDHAIGQILAFRGVIDSGNPWDVTAGNTAASSTSVSIPGDTTTVANCLVVLAVANATDTAAAQTSGYTNADLVNLVELTDVNTTQGVGGGFSVAVGEKASIGAYAATTATLATASAQGRISIALKPSLTTWTASAGSINSTSGVWTAPSLAGQTAKITASNGTLSVTINVPVLDAFPLTDPTLPVTWDRNLTVLVSMPEDRSGRATRQKSPPFDSYEVKFLSRSLTETNTVDAFFDGKGFGNLFIFEDKVRNVRRVGWFDSPIRHEGNDECAIDLSFRFLEARL